MSISKLKDEDARALLRAQNLGRLGCIADEEPYVVPIHYFFDGKDVYMHALPHGFVLPGAPGKLIKSLRDYPRACLQVDEIRNTYHWRSVIAYGDYEEILDEEERINILSKLFQSLPNLTPVESRLTQGLRQTIVFRLRVDNITGIGIGIATQ
jgi:uncharacterized protein